MVVPPSRSQNLSFWIFPVLLALGLIFLMVSGLQEVKRFRELVEKRDSLRVYNQKLNEKNAAMVREIHRLKNDPLFVEEIARREFGLVKADEIIFFIEDSPTQEANGNDKQNRSHSP